MKWPETHRKLAASGLLAFTNREFRAVTGSTPVSAKFLLIRYTKSGLLRRLRRGLYAVEGELPSQWALANRLYRPSYISLETALSYHHLIPETVYSITSVTTRGTREFDVTGTSYSYRTIKRQAFFGYRAVQRNGETFLIAEKVKALADYLYLIYLKGAKVNSRLRLKEVPRRELIECLAAFEHPGLVDWYKNDLKIPDHRIQH